MSMQKIIREDQRLVLLTAMSTDGDYSHNEYVLLSALGLLGHRVSHDHLRNHLSWLAEQELIAISDVSGVMVATLTMRGKDVAEGRVVVPGVKRPEPGM